MSRLSVCSFSFCFIDRLNNTHRSWHFEMYVHVYIYTFIKYARVLMIRFDGNRSLSTHKSSGFGQGWRVTRHFVQIVIPHLCYCLLSDAMMRTCFAQEWSVLVCSTLLIIRFLVNTHCTESDSFFRNSCLCKKKKITNGEGLNNVFFGFFKIMRKINRKPIENNAYSLKPTNHICAIIRIALFSIHSIPQLAKRFPLAYWTSCDVLGKALPLAYWTSCGVFGKALPTCLFDIMRRPWQSLPTCLLDIVWRPWQSASHLSIWHRTATLDFSPAALCIDLEILRWTCPHQYTCSNYYYYYAY